MNFFGSTFFPEHLIQNVFQILFCMIGLTEFIILIGTVWNGSKSAEKKEKQDKGSLAVIMIGYWLAIALNPMCVQFFHQTLPLTWFWVGAGLILLGVFIRVSSVWTLRKYFSFNVQVGSSQKIIRNGPYQYVRHPAYTGSILTLLGVAFCFRSLWGLIATVIIVVLIYGYRIGIEEKLMEKNFGQAYQDYEKSTKRLIPFVW
ncbi:methyltransferase family protein [Clostridium merdae]|uniref:methyltransferase family protein n=1 Tax=Clostridium merdae TaxID=1958780 RepID=UPI000A26E472|nr:isoprenylcysteine carboxylmethyltransferase family protein [Clostridium merdae]